MTHAQEPTGPTAWARIASLFVDFGVARGVARMQLLHACHLTDAALADPDARIPLVALYDLAEALQQLTGDPSFGLELPVGLEIDVLDALGFLFITSDTLGEAMERLLRYQRLWNEGEHLELRVEDGQVHMLYEPFGPKRAAHVVMAQVTLSDVVINTARFVPGLSFDEVCFQHPRPADVARYESVLKTPVRFGCAVNEVRFPERMLALPIPDANPMLCAFFERYASDKLKQLPSARSSVSERLRALIRQQLSEHEVKASDLAARLHMSTRTLQRRLGEEGTSLQAELDEVRRQQALYFLEHGTAIAELSWLLGYSEPAAFHRAFKRWTGTSPEAWRTRQLTARDVQTNAGE